MTSIVEEYEHLAATALELEQQAEAFLDKAEALRAQMASMEDDVVVEQTRSFTLDNPSNEVALAMATRIAGLVKFKSGAVEMYAKQAVGPVLGAEHVKALPQSVLDKLEELLGRKVTMLPESDKFYIEGYGEHTGCRMSPPLPDCVDSDDMTVVGEAAANICKPEYWGLDRISCYSQSTDGNRIVIQKEDYSPWNCDTPKLALMLGPKRSSPQLACKAPPKRQKLLSTTHQT
ncbi:MAG: hypothetical protein CMP20_15800 [Rickettsiales bacterium]|nr:hypothetical protein [Rickettsiales bacterium]